MNSQTQSDPLNPKIEECLRLQKCWPWFLGLGVVLIVVGGMAVGSAYIATLTTLLVFGSLLLAGGVVQIVNAFLARTWRGFLLYLLGGLLHLVLGLAMIDQPECAGRGADPHAGRRFPGGGSFRLIAALATRFSGRGWVALNLAITLALGVAISAAMARSELLGHRPVRRHRPDLQRLVLGDALR